MPGDLVPAGDASLVPADDIGAHIERFVGLRDYSPSSQIQVKAIIRRFLKWLEETGSNSPVQYRQHLLRNGCTRGYISTQFSVLRTFWEYLFVQGVVPHNPWKVVTVRSDRSSAREGLTPEEVNRLVAVLPDEEPRACALVNLLLRTGIRIQAAREANIEDIDTDAEVPRLWVRHKGKYRPANFVLLYPGAMLPLEDWLRVRPATDDPAIFVSRNHPHARLSYYGVYGEVRSVLDRAGIDKPPHSLRHTAITIAREAGASLDAVREMAGHSDPRTTLAYDHSIQRFANPAEAVIDRVLSGGGAWPTSD